MSPFDRLRLSATDLLPCDYYDEEKCKYLLSLPSMTSSLSTTRAGEEAVIIAVDEEKNMYQVVGHDAYTGENYSLCADF